MNGRTTPVQNEGIEDDCSVGVNAFNEDISTAFGSNAESDKVGTSLTAVTATVEVTAAESLSPSLIRQLIVR